MEDVFDRFAEQTLMALILIKPIISQALSLLSNCTSFGKGSR